MDKGKRIIDFAAGMAVTALGHFQPYFSQRSCASKLEKSGIIQMS